MLIIIHLSSWSDVYMLGVYVVFIHFMVLAAVTLSVMGLATYW